MDFIKAKVFSQCQVAIPFEQSKKIPRPYIRVVNIHILPQHQRQRPGVEDMGLPIGSEALETEIPAKAGELGAKGDVEKEE